MIYGLIFSVDLRRNIKFMQKPIVLERLQESKADCETQKMLFDKIQQREKQMRMRIIQERGIEDQGQLVAALNEHQDYQKVMKDAKETSEALDSAQMNISTF